MSGLEMKSINTSSTSTSSSMSTYCSGVVTAEVGWMWSCCGSALAGVTAKHGGPFGSCVVDWRRNRSVSCEHNTVLLESNPTRHGEMNAIRIAAQRLHAMELAEREEQTVRSGAGDRTDRTTDEQRTSSPKHQAAAASFTPASRVVRGPSSKGSRSGSPAGAPASSLYSEGYQPDEQLQQLPSFDLYTTAEPCPMCRGAILRASWIRNVYVGVDRHTAAEFGFNDAVFYEETERALQWLAEEVPSARRSPSSSKRSSMNLNANATSNTAEFIRREVEREQGDLLPAPAPTLSTSSSSSGTSTAASASEVVAAASPPKDFEGKFLHMKHAGPMLLCSSGGDGADGKGGMMRTVITALGGRVVELGGGSPAAARSSWNKGKGTSTTNQNLPTSVADAVLVVEVEEDEELKEDAEESSSPSPPPPGASSSFRFYYSCGTTSTTGSSLCSPSSSSSTSAAPTACGNKFEDSTVSPITACIEQACTQLKKVHLPRAKSTLYCRKSVAMDEMSVAALCWANVGSVVLFDDDPTALSQSQTTQRTSPRRMIRSASGRQHVDRRDVGLCMDVAPEAAKDVFRLWKKVNGIIY